MEVRLKVLVGSSAGQEIRVPAPKFFVGRAEDCHMRPKSDLISRHHCVLMTEEQAAVIRDLGSRNGTFVNDERIVGERLLESGDRLKIGPLEFEVRLVEGAKKRPRVTSIKEAAARTAATAGQDDVDISEWLDRDDPAGGTTMHVPASEAGPMAEPPEVAETSETREIEASDTEEFNLRATSVAPAQPAPAPARTPTPAPQPAAPAESAAPEKSAVPEKSESAAPAPVKPAAPAEPAATTPVPKTQPPKPKGPAGDSGKAAADVLKKFFQRR